MIQANDNLHRELEKQELQRILNSEVFLRSPAHSQFLSYVCEKYFSGETNQLKEYTIALEALGRQENFQPKVDPIVRVEASRLRNRLKKYYAWEGKNNPVQIMIPAGQYLPVFLHSQPDSTNANNEEVTPLCSSPALAPQAAPLEKENLNFSAPQIPADKGRRYWHYAALALSLCAVFPILSLSNKMFFPTISSGFSTAKKASQSSTAGPSDSSLLPEHEEIRIMAGSSRDRYQDHLGYLWGGDRFYTGGTNISFATPAVQLTRDLEIYRNAREGDFSYDIPLKPGNYELRLHFAENYYGASQPEGGGEASRLINVTANGKPLLTLFDIIADAGGEKTATIKVFKDIQPVEGFLRLRFSGFKVKGLLNGIEVLPGNPGTIRPVRIVTGNTPWYSKDGARWDPDRFYKGGRVVEHTKAIDQAKEPGLYQFERYGNFSYHIPVTPGLYTITLHFAETYFGSSFAGFGGKGSRVFDVYCNGKELLKQYDIYAETGGENRAVSKTFRHVPANALDKISLQFLPVRNYASVCAIEVIGEPGNQ
jgi:hypothetical protein